MKNEITCNFFLDVKEGKLIEFKELIYKIVDVVKKEPGTLTYTYNISEDGKKIHIVERYKNIASIISHIDESFAPFAKAFLSLVDIYALNVYGVPDNNLRERLDVFGAKYHVLVDGFSR
ncbi:antibiotic biosynthesis monooxygenase [Pseudoalteromonas fuliginea]|uniref:putative quinol monooxygenase n=1 Tax=Pseudoalteromonas TaxID=53246 RepID=UPI0002AAAC7D|nr:MULTISPECIES: antibiotic biosynthesis monooxygenase [unclassified Pseudoalteromonas]ALQ10533.1 hypothetical protein D172_020955 [Pseudoalteromonas sp. Bsw20308]MDQ2042839.1 antibiotic biosynthesis monooxygenase [Pseudoalteromonas sp. 20-92]